MTVAGGLTALATLVRLTVSIARLVAKLDEAMPVLFEIADAFRSPTLKARIESLEKTMREESDYTHRWRHQLTNDMQKVLLKLDLYREGGNP